MTKLKKLKPDRVITVTLHMLFWLAISSFYFNISYSRITYTDSNKVLQDIKYYDLQFLIPLLVGNIFKALLFYGNTQFLVASYLKKKKHVEYIAYLLAFLVMCYGLEIGADFLLVKVIPQTLPMDAHPPDHFVDLVAHQPSLYLVVLTVSFGARFTQDWVNHEKEKRLLIEEKLQTELKFLRSQINPHFLFNTLNNLYASALSDGSERTAQGIAKLSKLIRYMLHESNVQQISLDQELAYIETYIELQKSRFTGKKHSVNINFDVDIDRPDYLIAPILLITFIENAFKHGISKQQTTHIYIELKALDKKLHFTVENSINPFSNNMNEKSGLGLKNTRRRLELLYPASHSLEIVPNEDVFRIQLFLELATDTSSYEKDKMYSR